MAKKALITPRDLLAPPDGPLGLEVELERPICAFLDPPIEGGEIEVEGIGKARTDATGLATMPLGTLPAGTYRYRVRAARPDFEAHEAEALVRIVPRDTPVFITDIDRTIADVSSFGFVFRRNSTVRPLPGAVVALEKISRRMQVVYLTARDHIFTAKTKEWLRMNQFPEAPLLIRKVRFWSASPRRHKLACLAQLRAGFTELRWGVGDLRGDVEAYAAHGIPAILLAARPPKNLPPGTVSAAGWAAILDLIK